MGFFSKLKNAISHVPVVGKPLAAVYGVTVGPAMLAEDVARGGRIDRALVRSFKGQVADVRTVAPYAQAVVSFVPGVGQGVSGALGASLALAEGHPLSDAVLSGIKGAIPGGPLAQSAFSAATAIAQGKKLNEVALSALPLPDAQKKALGTALEVAQKISKGQKVADVVLTEALKQLPPNVAQAVQVGVAVGHAVAIQKHSHKSVAKVNNVLAGVNSPHPAERQAALEVVQKTQAKAERGDPHAAAMLTLLGRRAAAKRVMSKFRVDGHNGMVLRVGR